MDALANVWDSIQWEAVEAIGTWAAALGTIAAVWVALRLARRDNTIRLRMSATVTNLYIGTGQEVATPLVCVSIVNIGRRSATINSVGWRSGIFPQWSSLLPREYSEQTRFAAYSAARGSKLEDGDTANFQLPLDQWMAGNWRPPRRRPRWLALRLIRATAELTTGETRSCPISGTLRAKISEAS